MNDYSSWLERLKQRLGQDLPGSEAHFQMAPLARIEQAKMFQPNENTRTGGVLIMLYPKEDKIYFPLTLRSENTGVHSGQISFPGGRQDEGEDLIDTALRETWEEIGVQVAKNQVVGSLSPFYIPPSNYLVYPTVAAIDFKPDFKPSPHEVSAMLEIDLLDFKTSNPRKVGEINAKYLRADVPYFELLGQKVWGATAMILNEFMMILNENNW
ncbi:MAG: CoA pyrophosphatase [Microscillaceae bacterium]|jgi:8-oxo-dGTP pyrophosphatase MutT (NUDIX family)|nr:CoA pyrophosphatase [Microscillaceae bacterium]